MFRHVSSQRTLLMLHPIPSCFSSLYFNYWAFETILHLVLCVKLAIVVVCIITHFASCRTILIWFQERADFSVQECWSGSQVNFVIDIGQIMLWADQPFPEYHTFLVKNRVCQVLQHVTKESEASHWPIEWKHIYQKCLAHRTSWRPFWVCMLVYKLFNKMVVSW